MLGCRCDLIEAIRSCPSGSQASHHRDKLDYQHQRPTTWCDDTQMKLAGVGALRWDNPYHMNCSCALLGQVVPNNGRVASATKQHCSRLTPSVGRINV